MDFDGCMGRRGLNEEDVGSNEGNARGDIDSNEEDVMHDRRREMG